MKQHVSALGFVPAGRILADDKGRLGFALGAEFLGRGSEARRCGWVYLWIQGPSDGSSFQIVYVGKAGNTLRVRCGQHENGFVNSGTGRRHGERIHEYLRADSQHQMLVYARKSPEVELLGEAAISLCEAEERAMIAMCLRRSVRLWNYQSSAQSPIPNAREARGIPAARAVARPQILRDPMAEEENAVDAEQPTITKEDAFFAAIASYPMAAAAVAGLLNALVDRADCRVHYTFTDGADLRVQLLTTHGKDINVARIWWQKRRGGFAAELYLIPETARAVGATSAGTPSAGAPSNVRSKAFFAIPGCEEALVNAALLGLNSYRQDHAR